MALLSAVESTKESIHFYILTADLETMDPRYKPFPKKYADYLDCCIKKSNADSKVYLIDLSKEFLRDFKDSPNIKSSYTPYSLLRLYLDQIDEVPDKMLYLDSDIIVMKDISLLYSHELGDKMIGAVIDRYGRFFIGPRYVNAGVMLLNLKEIKKDGLFKKCRDYLKHKKKAFPDQDAINKYCHGKKLYLGHDYNEQGHLRATTIIRHYCNKPRIFPTIHAMVAKPWDIERIHDVYKTTAHDELYRKAKSLWRDMEEL
ncbi:MAG: glycosyltransferase family 8 protein [Bacilli bacterium]|jgi:lipopolysaccharide biosynthesis glycosyltransferase|nr:glycosyltransferase family 8 protein [Bacilli bacterium]MCH4211072.1 glycosyltransferase family 8 protein [Bacilli bacterium]